MRVAMIAKTASLNACSLSPAKMWSTEEGDWEALNLPEDISPTTPTQQFGIRDTLSSSSQGAPR